MQHMAMAEIAPKSPLLPLFQRGNVTKGFIEPLFEKEGPGEIYSTDFRVATLVTGLTYESGNVYAATCALKTVDKFSKKEY